MNDAEKLLTRMRATKSGWKAKDLHKLYLGFGFNYREGGKHIFYAHPQHPELYTTVTRSRTLAKGYITTAIKLIDQLKMLEGKE